MAGRLSDNVLAWIAGKTVEDFQAIEATFSDRDLDGTHLLFPDMMPLRRNAKGAVVEQQVLLRVPGADDELAARWAAIAHVNRFREKHGKMKGGEVGTLQEARDAIGAEAFSTLELHATVARCLHDPAPPHPRFKTLDLLRRDHLPEVITAMYRRMSTLRTMLDPCLDDLTDEQFWAVVHYIGEHQNISPLGGMAGSMEYVFLVRVCAELRQRTLSSSSTSTETSTPGSSDRTT